jgi:phosphoglucosamine mutase
MLTVLAEDLRSGGLLANDVVVTTVMSNLGLEERLEVRGIRVERVAVGDRNVAQRMREVGAILGAEPSGHVVMEREGTLIGDGLVAGVRVLQAARRSKERLSALGKRLVRWPQLLRNLRVGEKPPLEDVPGIARAIREAEASLGPRGRLVVRYSGTEPLLRIMAEGRERSAVERAVLDVETAARRLLPPPD